MRQERAEGVDVLLEHHADPNALNAKGYPPLAFPCSPAVVDRLLSILGVIEIDRNNVLVEYER